MIAGTLKPIVNNERILFFFCIVVLIADNGNCWPSKPKPKPNSKVRIIYYCWLSIDIILAIFISRWRGVSNQSCDYHSPVAAECCETRPGASWRSLTLPHNIACITLFVCCTASQYDNSGTFHPDRTIPQQPDNILGFVRPPTRIRSKDQLYRYYVKLRL